MIDCNNCKHLNIKDTKQIDITKPNICTLYHRRVFHHRAVLGIAIKTFEHCKELVPCSSCYANNYERYEEDMNENK